MPPNRLRYRQIFAVYRQIAAHSFVKTQDLDLKWGRTKSEAL